MKYTTLLSPTTGGGLSALFECTEESPTTVVVTNLAGSETADLQITYDGTNYVDVYWDGAQAQFTATNNAINVIGEGVYKVNLGSTASAAGVYAIQEGITL